MLHYIKQTFLTGLFSIALGSVFAQAVNADRPTASSTEENKYANTAWQPSLYPDGVIDAVPHEYKVQPWTKIREIDVAYAQRVWSIIPILEKQNYAFRYRGDQYSNGGAFVEILNHAIKTGKLVAFNPIDDRFTLPYDLESFEKAIGGGVDSNYVIDPETFEETLEITKKEFNVNSVTKFMVKEDWIFDRNAGRLVKRIIGIAPLKDEVEKATNKYLYSVPMYWVYYPKAREVLGQYEVYNPENLVKRMTWTDYLEGGYYSSFIEKTSKNNPLDTRLRNPQGEDLRGLIEGEKVLYDLLDKEVSMWER